MLSAFIVDLPTREGQAETVNYRIIFSLTSRSRRCFFASFSFFSMNVWIGKVYNYLALEKKPFNKYK